MSAKGKRIALLICDDFEQSEFEQPLEALKQAGAKVEVISADDKKTVRAMRHNERGDTFQADRPLKDAEFDNYDALVLPGGVINADRLRMVKKAREWVLDFFENGKLIAAICHAPWLLVSADVVEEKRLTSYFTLQDDIRNGGGEWINQPVIVDGNLITSRKPDDLPQFTHAIIEWFGGNSSKS